jgi:hypothetical protein
MNLEKTATSLAEQFPGGSVSDLNRQEARVERFGQIAFTGFGVMLLIGFVGFIAYIFNQMVVGGANFWAGLLLIGFLIFAALTLTYVFLRESIKDKKKKVPAAAASADPGLPGDTAPLLEEARFQPAVSVTENTTDLLHVETKTKKL